MEYIYVARSEDRKKILENFEKFKELSDGEIKLKFEREKKLGIVGVHDQILYLIALRKVMIERFGESGIIIEDDIIIKFEEGN